MKITIHSKEEHIMKETALTVQDQVKQIYTIGDLEKIGTMIAKSNLFGVKTPEQAIALCLIADAEGQHPALAATEYHIIQGQPSLKAKTLLSRFQATGGKIEWIETTDERAEAKFSHPSGGTLTVDWDMARAEQAGLTGNPTWKKYPRAMLRARVISEGVPAIAPGTARFYTSEEVQDFDERPAKNVQVAPAGTKTTGPTEEVIPDAVLPPKKTAAQKKKEAAAAKKVADTAASAEASKKVAESKLVAGAPTNGTTVPVKTAIEILEALEVEELTGTKINAATMKKIEAALETKFALESEELENWSKADKPDWTESTRVNLLEVFRLLKNEIVTVEDFRVVLKARIEF